MAVVTVGRAVWSRCHRHRRLPADADRPGPPRRAGPGRPRQPGRPRRGPGRHSPWCRSLLLIPAAWAAAARAAGPLGVAGPGRPGRVSRLGELAGRAGPVTGGIGVRMAFEPGHGRTAVPVRSALIGTTVAIASVLAALVFGTSLIGLVATPRRYGQNWAQMLDLGFGGVTRQLAAELLARDPAVTASAVGNYGQLTVGATRTIVPAVGIGPAPGPGFLTLLAGRAPGRPRRDRAGRPDHARGARPARADGAGHGQPGGISALVRPHQPDDAHRRRGRLPRVQPGFVHPHRPGHGGRGAGRCAVRAFPVNRLHREGHVLQLLPAPLPGRY